MSDKYVVEYTEVNPAYEEGAKMWKALRIITAVAFIAWLVL